MNGNKLLKISDLDQKSLTSIVEKSLALRKRIVRAGHNPFKVAPQRKGPVGLIFFEPSTRTRVSFERACHLTGRSSVLFSVKDSSFEKGETLEDALLNLRALGIYDFVIRSSDTG